MHTRGTDAGTGAGDTTMKKNTAKSAVEQLYEPPDFSLVIGGPLFQLLRRAHLSDDALHLVRQRIAVISLLAWLPLAILALLGGQAFDGVAVPFMYDIDVHVRFLLTMPLLIAAELLVNQRMRPLLKQFLERRLIPHDALPRFDAAIDSAVRLRNSVAAELLLIVLVYTFGVFVVWRQYAALDTATWYAAGRADGGQLTPAGMWFAFVSLPFFQFLLCRWYFRLFIWARFLWQVARIDLALVPTHPDRLGGLGFLAGIVNAFALLALAHGTLLAGQLANRIFFVGAALPQFKFEIAAVALFVLALVFAPLLVFAPQLARAKRVGLREYGTLAQRYVREFDGKWLRGGAPADEPLVGSGDIQSLADLNNSFDVVRGMRVAPVTKDSVVSLGVATLLPVVPLGLTMMPLEELLRTLIGIVF
jgi:hypothetical protein